MPAWLPPLAAASFVVVLLNVALIAQRRRAADWQRRFVRELHRWDGRVPEELRRR
ncbi:MAG TPA: hypothetical protein VH297_04155 [Gaiellaceae bacterium]|jgi:hypothetical protein